MLYNVTLKTSGSPWLVAELRDGKGIEATNREVNRHVWKGVQAFRLSVQKQKLDLRVAEDEVIKDLELPNYQPGEILLGTYDTRYGPKPVRVESLRIRAK